VITVDFERPECIANLQSLASSFKTKLTENSLNIPASLGEGFAWAETLPCGISILVFEGMINEDYVITRSRLLEPYFTLSLCEVTPPKDLINRRRKLPANALVQSCVTLKDRSEITQTLVPDGTKVCMVEFFFTADNLRHLVGDSITDDLVKDDFPTIIKNDILEPIDRIYRVMLDDLFCKEIDHPLRINFIQNRVLLLLEKFILKLYSKKSASGKKNKDDDVSRLMQIEGLLVKDFSIAPPTIDELSRISAMSPTKLKNDFKSTYGLPIYEYYQKNRMLKAKSLLLEGQYSIKEVGMLVGYSNLSHFANTFKKEFGILPSELTSKDGMLVYNL
jgi:AraC-like DNA-binding protein